MTKIKRILKEMKWDALLTGVLYVVLGVMALALPETMEKILGYMIGVVLIVGGAVSMIAYLLRDAHQNYYHNDFLHGLIGIAAGILVLTKMEIVVGLISFLLGVLVLVSGCSKLQDVIDMKRLECGNWIVMLILAAVNVGFGVLLICNPFSWTILLFRLLGVGLIFSGIIDCVSTFYFAGRIRKYLDSLTAVDSTFVEVTQAGAPKKAETPKKTDTPKMPETTMETEKSKMPEIPAQTEPAEMPETPSETETPMEPVTTVETESPKEQE